MPPSADTTDAQVEAGLIADVGRGDREAFRALYSRYKVPLFSLAVRMVGNSSDAEELLQDTFVKIWRGASSYDPGESRPFTWVVTILRRTCIDYFRRKRTHLGSTPLLDVNGAPPEIHSRDDTRRATQDSEDSSLLRGALAEVPAGQRQALELVLFSGMTHTEIAQRLQEPVGTIKSWIRRGLLQLRTHLENSAP